MLRLRTGARGLALLGAAVGLALLAPQPLHAQGNTEFDAADQMFALYELSQGGRPLYAKLFRYGWPTDKKHVELTLEVAAKSADLYLSAYLGSGAGQSLGNSAYQFARADYRSKKLQKISGPSGLLNEELRVFRSLTNFKNRGGTHGFKPVFLPYQRAKRAARSSWSARDIRSWRWGSPGGKHTLKALGFALLAEASFAKDQLSQKRREEQKGKSVQLIGRTARDGFMALAALQAAAAKVYALRHRLVVDYKGGSFKRTTELLSLSTRRFFYPQAWTSDTSGGRATYTLAKHEGGKFRSHLGAASATLLGVCKLAELTSPKATQDLKALFQVRNVLGKQLYLYDHRLPAHVLDVALFIFQSLRTLHVSVEGKGYAASYADPRGQARTVTAVDLGLFLMALEAFTKIELAEAGYATAMSKRLKTEQGKAHKLVKRLSRMIRTWQKNQNGFYDVYDTRSGTRHKRGKSLASQAFAVRGLLAAHRVISPSRPDSSYVAMARKAIAWLDASRWDPTARAYVERGKKEVKVFAALAVLGALRDMALQTGDGRYLMRYKQYFESLRAAGLFQEGSSSAPPGLAGSVTFAKSK